MKKRGVTFVLATALALLGPVPVSLCAVLGNLPADCIPTPHCETMGSQASDAKLSAPTDDCCAVSSAPLPERQVNSPAPVASLELVAAPEFVVEALQTEVVAIMPRARSAPPDLQSALCVFLI